jgi:hypothetical protein
MNKLHFFIDEVSGVLKVITDMPEEPKKETYGWADAYGYDSETSGWMIEGGEEAYYEALEQYQSALKAAKRDAIEVILRRFVMIMRDSETDVPYCSQCCKEVDERPVAPPLPVEEQLSNTMRPIAVLKGKSLPVEDKEELIDAARYGYEYHQKTSFPEKDFDSNCKNNFLQYLQAKPRKQLE